MTDAEALQDQEAKGWSFVMLLVSVLAFLSKSVLSYQQSKERYHSLVTSSLYEKVPHLLAAGALRSFLRAFVHVLTRIRVQNMDSDRGVFFYLINSLEEQELMETVLGYYFLWTQGPMTVSELDKRTEQFLVDHCSVEVDFEVTDSLDKLIRFGLATVQDGVYTAVSTRDAHSTLYEQWCKTAPKAKKKHRTSSDRSERSERSERSSHKRTKSHKSSHAKEE